MGKGKEVTVDERSFIVGMKRGEASVTAIAKGTKRTRGTIATILLKFQCTENAKTLKRSGRSSVTTERESKLLTRLVKENRRSSAKALAKKIGCKYQQNGKHKEWKYKSSIKEVILSF